MLLGTAKARHPCRRRGERGGSKAWQWGAEMQSLKGCHWERAEGKQNDLGKALAKVTLHSQDPDAFLHPPPKGFASPFSVQGTPSSHARHQPAALHAASTAAEATLQAEGWPWEGRTEPGAPGGKMRDTLKPLSGQEGRPDTTEMATRGKQTHHRPGTGGRESIHRAQDLHRGLRAGCVHSRLTPGCTTPGAPWHCEHIPRAPCRAESATSAPGQGREGQQRARTATPRSPPCVPAPGQPSWEPGRSCSIPAARSCCQQL